MNGWPGVLRIVEIRKEPLHPLTAVALAGLGRSAPGRCGIGSLRQRLWKSNQAFVEIVVRFEIA